jgi:hypothetical protein
MQISNLIDWKKNKDQNVKDDGPCGQVGWKNTKVGN